MGFSIKTKLVLAIGAPLLAAYLGMVWCEYHLGRQEALAAMRSHLAELAARRAAELDGKLSTAEEIARTLARVVASWPELSAEELRGLLRDSLQANPTVFGMGVAFEREAFSRGVPWFAPYCCRDGQGGLRYVDIAEATPGYTRLHWYRPAKSDGRPFWTEPYFDAGVGERMMCTYSVPVVRRGGVCGVLTVDVLSEELLEEIGPARAGGGYFTLTSRSGTFIVHPDLSLVLKESLFSLADRRGLGELAEVGRQMIAGKAGVRRIRDDRGGEPKWMAFAPVESADWSLAAVIPEHEVMAPIHSRLLRSLAILAAGLVMILGIVLLVSLRVTRPIERLTEAAESLGAGNLDARVRDVAGRDEIARLARQFNTMVGQLKLNVEGRLREETARRAIEGELKAARDIQASLLPGMLPPERAKGFTLHAVNAPAKLVAGDFFDFFFVNERTLALVMADVSGKGVPAAMYMAVARTKLRDFASPQRTPAEVLSQVNRCLARENDRGMFVSVFLGYYNVLTGELTYANAGHNPPYLVRKGGALDMLDPTGPLVAPFPDAEFRDARCCLQGDDLLVLFTDGVTEAGAGGKEWFGEERLERLLETIASSQVATVCQRVIEAASDFGGGDLADDATVLALRRTCPAGSPADTPVVPSAALDQEGGPFDSPAELPAAGAPKAFLSP